MSLKSWAFALSMAFSAISGNARADDPVIVQEDIGQCIAEESEKPSIIRNLEQAIDYYDKYESPKITFSKGITLNDSYEKRKKEEVQKLLVSQKLLTSYSPGCFETATVNALKKFQAKNHIKKDGKVGESTSKALSKIAKFEIDKNYELVPDENCFLGLDDIKMIEEIQDALNFHNYLSKEPNGKLDDETVNAIKIYKRRNAIADSGRIDRNLVNHLLTPSEKRADLLKEAFSAVSKCNCIEQGNNIYINLPEFRLRWYFGGIKVFDADIIIGNTSRKGRWQTRVQQGVIEQATINPWWSVIPGDLTDETINDLERSGSLRQTMEQLVDGKWIMAPDAVVGTKFRQRPGPWNALGRVAYDFKSIYGEKLHGTTAKHLFNKNVRAFSHGCMRLSDELKLFRKFQELGLASSELNLEKLIEEKGKDGIFITKKVKLSSPVKINVIYFRAFAEEDENGIYMTMPADIYDYRKSRAK